MQTVTTCEHTACPWRLSYQRSPPPSRDCTCNPYVFWRTSRRGVHILPPLIGSRRIALLSSSTFPEMPPGGRGVLFASTPARASRNPFCWVSYDRTDNRSQTYKTRSSKSSTCSWPCLEPRRLSPSSVFEIFSALGGLWSVTFICSRRYTTARSLLI